MKTKGFSRSLSFIMAIVMMFTVIGVGSFAAGAATNRENLAVNQQASYTIDPDDLDIYDVSIYFDSAITVNMSSSVKMNVEIYKSDDTNNAVYAVTGRTRVCDPITLPAGNYVVALYGAKGAASEINYMFALTDAPSGYASSTKIKKHPSKNAKIDMYWLEVVSTSGGAVTCGATWTSSNKKVATVNQAGFVLPKNFGTAVITATMPNGVVTKYKVNVTTKNLYIFSGSSRTLPTLKGKKKLKFKSASSSKAKVNGQKVKGVKQGKTTLTAKYGKKTYKVNVYVINYKEMYKVAYSYLKDSTSQSQKIKVNHVWRGYNSYGLPAITFDWSVKKSDGKVVHSKYYNNYCFYNKSSKNFSVACTPANAQQKLTSKVKVK